MKHSYPLELGYYSDHTSRSALETGEARIHEIEQTKAKLRSTYAEYGESMQRLLDYAGLDPDHALLRWGNFDRTIYLPSTVFQADDTGRSYRFRPGRWALSDYNFETPSTSLNTDKKTVNPVLAKRTFERFDYPGRYLKKSPGEALAKLRIEYEETAYQEIEGEGACVGFAAGTYFSLSNADTRETGKEFVIRSVDHVAEDWSQLTQDAKPATCS